MIQIPIWLQERPESCVPACLRMILAAYGVDRTEADIYTCCQADVDGTLPSAAADCARALGFDASAQRLAGIDALQEQLKSASLLPIVYVHLGPLMGVGVIHAVVVEAVDLQARTIHVIDPAYAPHGRREWALDQFEVGWRRARFQAILGRPSAQL